MVNQLVDNQKTDASTGQVVTVAPAAGQEAADCPPVKPRRTPGLWAVDFLLYPVLTNVGVFVASVYATYLTNKGGMRNARGEPLHGRVGEWFHNRGNSVVKFFEKFMSHEKADMSKMVFFSFLDGSLLAPLTKFAEDRREKIAKWIDDRIGTTPEQEAAAYKAEPKQSWFSVIGGRLAVASIVAPTAYLLSKEWSGKSFNKRFFYEPGRKFGEWVAKKPGLAKFFGKLDIAELGAVGLFEEFYTSVCTAGLYVTSRCLARLTGRKKNGEQDPASVADTHDSREAQSAGDAPAAKSYAQSITPRPEKPGKAPPSAYTQKLADSASSPAQPAL